MSIIGVLLCFLSVRLQVWTRGMKYVKCVPRQVCIPKKIHTCGHLDICVKYFETRGKTTVSKDPVTHSLTHWLIPSLTPSRDNH